MGEQRATFSAMQEGTAEDWGIISDHYRPFAKQLPDRIIAHLMLLDGDFGGIKAGDAGMSAGDIGDTLGSYNHPDIAAAILKPFVSEENLWMVEKHGIFQGYYFFHHLGMDRHLRDQFKDHPLYQYTAEFCAKYDATAFDADYESEPLAFFEPMLRNVFAKPKRSIYKSMD